MRDQLRGKELVVIGGTGFLGKVWLSLLLSRVPEVGHVHLVVRPKEGLSVSERFTTKVLTSDQYTVQGFGHLMEYPEAVVTSLSEEHGVVDLSRCAGRPAVGEVVEVVPNHCCVVSNMVDEVYGVRGGQVETVWRVAARGTVR